MRFEFTTPRDGEDVRDILVAKRWGSYVGGDWLRCAHVFVVVGGGGLACGVMKTPGPLDLPTLFVLVPLVVTGLRCSSHHAIRDLAFAGELLKVVFGI